MTKRLNLVGKRFCYLVCTSYYGVSEDKKRTLWYFKCDCGKEIISRADAIKRGVVVSCGCYNRKNNIPTRLTHGLSKTLSYKSWAAARDRCYNPKNPKFKNYGARGIRLCDHWHDFENFYRDMGDRPSTKYSINRINNDGDYCKENCEWAESKKQSRNKTTTRYLIINNEKIDIKTASELYGVAMSTIRYRISHGWNDHQAVGL
jgi:hypothetical protein